MYHSNALANSSSATNSNASFSSFNSSGAYNLNQAVQDWMCASQGATTSQGTSGGLNVGIPIHGIPLQFGGDLSSQDSAMWFAQHCSTNSSNFSNSGSQSSGSAGSNASRNSANGFFTTSQVEALASRFMPKQNVDAWKACMLAKIGNQKSERIGMSYSINGSALTVRISWHPDAIRNDAPLVREFYAFGASCQNAPKRNEPLVDSELIVCTADGDSAITIALNTNQGSAGPIELPAPRGAGLTNVPESFSCTMFHALDYQFTRKDGELEDSFSSTKGGGTEVFEPVEKGYTLAIGSNRQVTGTLLKKVAFDYSKATWLQSTSTYTGFILVPDDLKYENTIFNTVFPTQQINAAGKDLTSILASASWSVLCGVYH
jgi:hypothetical protein